MQFSINSNAAIESMIRSHPTLVGQWRAAVMQLHDRLDAIESHHTNREILKCEIELLEVGIEQEQKTLWESSTEQKKSKIQQRLLAHKIVQKQSELERGDRLLEDAKREAESAQKEVDRIVFEAGCDFSKLSTEEFQVLMAQEFELNELRWLVAQSAAPALGLPPEVCKRLMELPLNRINEFISQYQEFVRTSRNAFYSNRLKAGELSQLLEPSTPPCSHAISLDDYIHHRSQ